MENVRKYNWSSLAWCTKFLIIGLQNAIERARNFERMMEKSYIFVPIPVFPGRRLRTSTPLSVSMLSAVHTVQCHSHGSAGQVQSSVDRRRSSKQSQYTTPLTTVSAFSCDSWLSLNVSMETSEAVILQTGRSSWCSTKLLKANEAAIKA